MRFMNLLLATIFIFVILLSGCRPSGNSNSANANISTNANQSRIKREVKPADFTITTEELSKEFVNYQAASSELFDKYYNKTLAVTGRVWRIWRKNRGKPFNYVFLYPPELENAKDNQRRDYSSLGFKCTYEDSEAPQMEPLKSGDTVTLQGLYESPSLYAAGGVRYYGPPKLRDCVVVEIK